jgi:hypothetical protein
MSGKEESEQRARHILVTFLRSVERPVDEDYVVFVTSLVLSGVCDPNNFVMMVLGSLDHPNHDDMIEAFGRMRANDTSNTDNSNLNNANEAFEGVRQIDDDGSSISTNTGSIERHASVLVEDIHRVAIATNGEESQDQEEEDDGFRAQEHQYHQQVPIAENHQAQPQEPQDATHSTLEGDHISQQASEHITTQTSSSWEQYSGTTTRSEDTNPQQY